MGQVIEQQFSGGMRQDIDKALQPPNTYRYARNGRLLYNRSKTDSSDGHSMAFSNVPGNALALSLPVGSKILHMDECRQGNVVFSISGADSEIGIWYYDEETNGVVIPGTYKTLYTDRLDPHLKNRPYILRSIGQGGQDRLDWQPTDTFDSEVRYESELVERIYWTNRRGAKHVLNLRDAPASVNSFTGYYPSYWSAHAFRDRPDVVFPLPKLKGRGKGSLPSGAYQIAVQYRSKNGVRSAFSPVTRRVFVTSEPLEAYNADGSLNTTLTTGYRSNHHNRTMGASGKVTGESLKWELKNVDARWSEIVVAVLYYETQGQPVSVTTLKPITITGQYGTATTISVEIKQLDGEEITIAELSSRNEPVLSVGTLASNQNRLFEANLKMLKPIAVDTSTVQFMPVLKSMRADSTLEPTFQAVDNPISKRKDNDPLTNSAVQNSTITRTLFGSVTESYSVEDDFLNDKGQVWEWLHGSYFRGETEEFAAVLFDRIGQPMFAYPLPQYTFPEQYTPGPNGEADYYSLTKQDSGSGLYDLRIMGVSMSGIRIPVADLYDDAGRLNVSGMAIVKRKRLGRLVNQGVIFPVCLTDNCNNDTGRDQKPFPLPYLNYFSLQRSGTAARPLHLYPYPTPCTTASSSDNGWRQTYDKQYYANYHSPDILIEESFSAPSPGDVLKHVGVAGQAYSQMTIPLLARISPFRARHDYTKSYNTNTTFSRFASLISAGRPSLGSTTRLSFALLLNQGFDTTYEKFDKDDLNMKFESQTHPEWTAIGNTVVFGDGLLQRNCVLLKTSDWPSVDVAESETRAASWRIVNYIKATPERSSDTEPFYSTGHFQPITQEILDSTTSIFDPATGNRTHYEFNNVEVWGGDAHVGLFDFTRIYPFPSDACEKHDYSISHIIPIESKYNLMLRQGRSFARNAVRPEETVCDNTGEQFTNGVMHQQPEDWNYNRVLLVDTSVVSYAPQPRDYLPVIEQPSGFCWTPVKQAGQLLDNWRIRLAGDAGQGDGSMGTITKLAKSEVQGLYAWHQHGLELLPLDAMEMRANDAGTIVTDSGAVFHRGIPISKRYGTQHPGSVWVFGGQMGAWDARMGVLLRHYPGGLDIVSQTENVKELVEVMTYALASASDASMASWNCVAGVDLENGEVFTTFSKKTGQSKTLGYSPAQKDFTCEYDLFPTLYGSRGRLLTQINPLSGNQVWLHNRGKYGQFFGQFYRTLLRFIVNPAPTQNKVFTNGGVNVNGEAASKKIVRITHSTPNGGDAQRHVLTPPTDDRFNFHKNTLEYPAHEWDWDNVKEPLRDKYQMVEIEIQNDDSDTLVSINTFRTFFRSAE